MHASERGPGIDIKQAKFPGIVPSFKISICFHHFVETIAHAKDDYTPNSVPANAAKPNSWKLRCSDDV